MNALSGDDLVTFFSDILSEAARARPPVLLVHSSLSSFGRVDDGAEAVVAALAECAHATAGRARSRRFTLVMPYHSGGDARVNGRIAAAFGSARGVVRSAHPDLAFAGKGPLARRILRGHRAEYGLGDASPVGRLYAADASVLMLGTGYETCTVMHLAEYRLAERLERRGGRADRVTCSGRGKTWTDIAYRTELFPALGAAFERALSDRVARGPIPGARASADESDSVAARAGAAGTAGATVIAGAATTADDAREWRLVGVRDLVDFCVDTSGYLG